jgi:hypothetical protein
MRVVFLNLKKKLELITAAPPQFKREMPQTILGEKVTVYHGTSLASLYLIARDRKLGSPVGFTSTNYRELERDGVFYVTIQRNYAYTAAYGWASRLWPPALQQWLAGWEPNQNWIDQIKQLSDITYDRISTITGINDVLDLYLTMRALAQAIRPNYRVPDAASVVLEIVMDGNFIRSEAIVDEDIFIWWFMGSGEDVKDKIMRLVLNNKDFRSWIKETTGLDDEEIDSKQRIELELGTEVARRGYLKEYYIRMYRALREMAENGPYKEAARDFLQRMAPFSDSFFFSRQLSFDESGIKAITAEIITKWGEIEKIDLLNDNEALDKIERIMKKGIEWYAKYIREEATKRRPH